MDSKVLQVQQWLNKKYSSNANYTQITEDGNTGNETVTAIIKGFQIETGVTVDGKLGNGTLNAIGTLSNTIDTSIATNRNKVYLLQGAMYCKGYEVNGFDGFYGNGVVKGVKEFKSGAGFSNPNGDMTSKFLKALLNTDSFKLVKNGDAKIRTIQQRLNASYNGYMDLIPCSGIYEKYTNKGIIKALQSEIGVTVDGVVGNGTLSSCPVLKKGDNPGYNLLLVLQYALYCNGFDPNGFDGAFGAGVENAVKNFQEFTALSITGTVDKDTWASLLISCGNRERKGKACDVSKPLSSMGAQILKIDGRTVVGRYIAGGTWKRLTREEMELIKRAGLRIFLIYQTSGSKSSYFTSQKGRSDAYTAISNVEKLGFKTGTIIYFAVDYDAIDAEVTSNILPYFKAISETFKKAVNKKGYRVGVYGARNICNRVSNLGYAQSSFVSDMSTGYSGNIGHLLPKNWAFDQISTVKLTMNGETVEADNNIMSGRYYGENEWDAVPVKKANPFLLFEYDSHVLTEKDRNIEAAREAVMARLETDEDFDWNYDPSDALLHFGDTTRKKEEYRYNYDEFSDENGVFNLFKDYLKPDKEPEVTLELVDYEYYSQKRINELNNGNKLAKFVASFLGGAGQVLSLLMTLTEAELEGEDVRKAFVRDVVDTTNEEAKSAVIETILLPANSSDIKATIFSTLYTLCVDGQSYYESLNEEKDHYITQYNYRPTGGTSGDDGQSKFVIYVGDSMVQLRYLVNGVYQGDYYVYLRNYVPKCVWFYSVKLNE